MKKYAALLLLVFIMPVFVFGQGPASIRGFPRLEPDPKAREFFNRGLLNNGFSWEDLAEISVWASGGNVSAVGQIHATRAAIADSGQLPAGKREKAEFILDFLHRNVFRSYSKMQTRVDAIFVNGRFNCVSSSVLYMILCKAFGIEVSGVITEDHAFVMVHIDGENIDVETTTAFGFNPGSRREFHDEFGRLTGFTYVPAQNHHDRQTISPIELVSLIMSNRIVELENARRFAEAVPLAIDRTALLSGNGAAAGWRSSASFFENPKRDMMNRLFNYSAFLINSGREEDFLRWAAAASARYPDENFWQELIMAAANNRIQRFIRANQLTQARTFLSGQKAALSQSNYAQLDTTLLETELLSRANRIRSAAEGNDVISAIENARINGRIENSRAAEFLTFAIQKTAAAISAAPGRDWLAAINFIENAVSRFGSNQELERALQTFRNNRAIDFHNNFAAAWNRRNFEEAGRILNEGLAEFPANRQLLLNREMLENR